MMVCAHTDGFRDCQWFWDRDEVPGSGTWTWRRSLDFVSAYGIFTSSNKYVNIFEYIGGYIFVNI